MIIKKAIYTVETNSAANMHFYPLEYLSFFSEVLTDSWILGLLIDVMIM